ncbi:putative 3-ketoacyl-CoA thiolase B protein [Naja naja]|nr:putative 3-ketoacyl-CoA thiolase B protein [Naja naja]
MERMKVVLGHLTGSPQRRVWAPSPCRASLSGPDDVVVVHGRRTPIARSKRGGFKETTPDELLAAVMTAVLNDVKLSPEQLGDICVGNVLQPGAGAMMVRIGQFISGIPETVPISSVNRQCSSGLQALINIAGGIRNGSYDVGLACGTDDPGDVSSRIMDFSKARDCLIPMGITSENVAERFGISREKQDAFALSSQQNQVSDGAAAVLLARRSAAAQLGLPVLGVLKSFAVVGVPPDVMGIGPAYAIPVALKKAGLTVNDIDVFEINEAFASQAVYCVEKLGIPMEKVNPLGGAIALGHPLGCTGARQVVTLLNELKRRGKRGYGVVSMCIGSGMGAAAVFEYPGK